jgi:hypothetical protein
MGIDKSYLISIIIHYLLDIFPDKYLVFFYYSGNRKDTTTIVFRSLVSQLSQAADGMSSVQIKALYDEESRIDPKGDLFSLPYYIELLVEIIKSLG